MKSLKQRIKEELQIATASRRLELDEAEEVHRMEFTLAEKERERRIKAKRESRDEAWQREQLKQLEADRLELEKLIRKRQNALAESSLKSLHELKSSLRMSPQNSLLTGGKHRRQNSDPMNTKFSPIDEDLNLENWLKRYGLSGNGKFSPQLVTSGTLKKNKSASYNSRTDPKQWDFLDDEIRNFGGTLPLPRKSGRDMTSTLPNHKSLSRSSEMLAKLSMLDKQTSLALSHSESSLPLTAMPAMTSRTPTYFSDGDEGGISDARIREERKLQLQMEIGLRKLQLEETQYLQNELRKLAEMPEITPIDMDKARSLYRQRVKMRDEVRRFVSQNSMSCCESF